MLAELVEIAEREQAAGAWGAAAEAWEAVRRAAVSSGRLPLARASAANAVEALRRDDRPAAMLVALKRALGLAEGSDREGLEVQLLAALLDAGQLRLAVVRGRELLARCAPNLRLVVADTLAGALQLRGDVIGLRGLVAQLDREATGPARLAVGFRRAQLLRLQGQLDEASEELVEVHKALAERPGGQGGAAAALTELAEIATLRGQTDAAAAFLQGAADLWTQAGRRSGLYQVEAARALASLAGGATTFLPGLLDGPVDYAAERGLSLVEARCRLARGLCRHAGGSDAAWADLDAAILLADTAEAPLLGGRARLERARLGLGDEGGPVDVADIERAVELLSGDRLWQSRALMLLAQRLAEDRPDEAIRAAGTALCRFKAMGLDRDEAAARELLGGLGGTASC